ncbi:hypothetical protein C8R46DRAFT_1116371 [Mycena filopes]|nr:hypothetical protein C8R46DRAFT_1116371 [Mycena filopes]
MLSLWRRRSNSSHFAPESLAFPIGWASLIISSPSLRRCMFSDSVFMPLTSPPPTSLALHSRPSPTSKFSGPTVIPYYRYCPIFQLYLCSLISRWWLAYGVATMSCASWRSVPNSSSSFSCAAAELRMNQTQLQSCTPWMCASLSRRSPAIGLSGKRVRGACLTFGLGEMISLPANGKAKSKRHVIGWTRINRCVAFFPYSQIYMDLQGTVLLLRFCET